MKKCPNNNRFEAAAVSQRGRFAVLFFFPAAQPDRYVLLK